MRDCGNSVQCKARVREDGKSAGTRILRMLPFLIAFGSCMLLWASLWLWFLWSNRKLYAAARSLPISLPTLPLIGHAHHFMTTDEEVYNRKILHMVTQPGHHATCAWLGPRPHVLLHTARDFQQFITSSKNVEKSVEYGLLKFAFGNGLATAPGEMWKRSRRHLNPVFHSRNLEHSVSSLNGSALATVRSLRAHLDHGPVDVLHDLSIFTANSTLKMIFGKDHQVKNERETLTKFFSLMKGSTSAFQKRVIRAWIWPDCIFNVVYRSLLKGLDKSFVVMIRPTLHKILASCKVTLESDGQPLKVDDSSPITVSEAFHTLQQSNSQFDETYMKGEIMTLLMTGTDTVAVTMSSCLIALGSHLHVQIRAVFNAFQNSCSMEDKLYKEIVEVVGEGDSEITTSDLNNMPYLDQVLKETMRRFVIVPWVMRKADKDVQMDDFVIPKDMTVALALSSLHMDPGTFARPRAFDPDHFSPESVASREKYSYLPFAGGTRDCIGKHFAMIQMKIMIAQILREFLVHSDMDIQNMTYKYGILIESANGYKVRFMKRTKS